MNPPKLLIWCTIAYAALLLIIRGLLPAESIPPISLVGIPLVIVVTILVQDLARRSIQPSRSRRTSSSSSGFAEDPVMFLSGQIRVAAGASDSYFEKIVRGRLKDMLITKVALEKGLEKEMARAELSDPTKGPKLLGDKTLYTILYGPLPTTWRRSQMIDEAVDMIGAWTG